MKWKSLSNLRLFWFNLDGPGRFRTGVKKAYFRTCYFNADNKEQFVSQRMTVTVNDSESNDRIQFKIFYLNSKTNRKYNVDATEELQDLTKKYWCSNKQKQEKESQNNLQNKIHWTIWFPELENYLKLIKISSWAIMLITNKQSKNFYWKQRNRRKRNLNF